MTQEFVTLPRTLVAAVINTLMDSKTDDDFQRGREEWAIERLVEAMDEQSSAVEQPQVEQEPVAVVDFTTEGWRKIVDALRTLPDGAQLYTRPQNLQCKSTQARLATLWGYVKEQPKLEPLTESAIVDIVIDMNGNEPTALFWRDLARAIEAAHNIK